MRFFLLTIFLCMQFGLFSQQKVKVFVTYTNSYCGGARPTEEILAKYNTPRKLAKFKIKLVGQKTEIVTTDSIGYFIKKLKLGKYSIFLTEEKSTNTATNYDPGCSKMLSLMYGELQIQKKKTNYVVNLYFPCNPCQLHNKP